LTARNNQFRAANNERAVARSADEIALVLRRTCQTSIDGRRAAKALAQWSEQFHISEPELQILWRLREVRDGVDQTSLAKELVISPAQVSSCVERLRVRELIVHEVAAADRRRHLWQLTRGGNELLDKVVQAANEQTVSTISREAAA